MTAIAAHASGNGHAIAAIAIPRQLCGVPAERIDDIWSQVAPLIELATGWSRGKETAFDIRRSLMARDCQLWVWWEEGVRAVFITEIVDHARKRTARIRICCGQGRKSWESYLPVIEAWARSNGAAAMELIARPGWEKVLLPQGYERTHVLLEKDLTDA